MFVNMAQGIYNAYFADVAAVDAFFAGNARGKGGSERSRTPLVPAAASGQSAGRYILAYTQAIVAAHKRNRWYWARIRHAADRAPVHACSGDWTKY